MWSSIFFVVFSIFACSDIQPKLGSRDSEYILALTSPRAAISEIRPQSKTLTKN